MPVFRWGHSWEAFEDLEREVDRLLNSVNFAFHGIRLGSQFPAVNLYELDNEYLLTSELPGTKAEDLEITISNGLLNITGADPSRTEYRNSDTGDKSAFTEVGSEPCRFPIEFARRG
jgi:HSP20 family molecular chaperone IbpA